jgi:hypothetical protein
MSVSPELGVILDFLMQSFDCLPLCFQIVISPTDEFSVSVENLSDPFESQGVDVITTTIHFLEFHCHWIELCDSPCIDFVGIPVLCIPLQPITAQGTVAIVKQGQSQIMVRFAHAVIFESTKVNPHP